MIIVLKTGCTAQQISDFCTALQQGYHIRANTWTGTGSTVIGLVGDMSPGDAEGFAMEAIVESIRRVREARERTDFGAAGGGNLAVIAGPCSAGSREQIRWAARLCGEVSLEMKKEFGNLTLCGFMGSGKTTVGRVLAARIGRRFVDLDEWIERKEGMAVSEIFARHGEARFRELERNAAAELSRETGLVIAAGGGTLLDAACARSLRAGGVVVLLDASLAAVRGRLAGDDTRPLLRRPDRDEAMRALYAARRPVYRERAELSVPADGTPDETADAVLCALKLKPSENGERSSISCV